MGEPQLIMHRENSVFRVETAAGPAALRIHRAGYHSWASIKSELAWMAHLKANGIAVPEPVPTRNGALLIELNEAGASPRIVDLLTWLGGAPLGKTGAPLAGAAAEQTEIFTALGKSMARLHNVSDAWQLPEDFRRHAWNRDGLVGENPFWGRFWEISNCSADETKLLNSIRLRAAQDLEMFTSGGADYGLIHADLVRENILVQDGQIQMIDFDDAGFGFRLFDIATTLFKNRGEPHYEALKSALISGYATLRPLSRRDLEALPLFMLLRALTYLGWGEARKSEPGMAARRQRFKSEALELALAYCA
jgi:Ser/Thr protein kinase RdoA (MazF antagonist)